MNTTRKELKMRARRALMGNYGTVIGASLIVYAINWALSGIFQIVLLGQGAAATMLADMGAAAISMAALILVFYAAVLFVSTMFSVGFSRMYLNISRKMEVKLSDLFWAFRSRPLKFMGIAAAILGIVILWMIPIFVLAFGSAAAGETTFLLIFMVVYYLISLVLLLVVYLNYSLFYYVLVEDPDKGIIQALRESRELMQGSRGRYFVLGLSFLGMELLAVLSLGIGMLWVAPYMGCTLVMFYLDVKPQPVYEEPVCEEPVYEEPGNME